MTNWLRHLTGALFALSATALGAQLPSPADTPDPAQPRKSEGDRAVRHHPMRAIDLVTLPRLGEISLSSDGHHLVYQVTHTDPKTLERSRRFYLLDLASRRPDPIPLELDESARDVEFGADGALYFLSNRPVAPSKESDEKDKPITRLWRAELSTEGKIIPPVPASPQIHRSIVGYRLSPDGRKIALWRRMARACVSFDCPSHDESSEKTNGTGRLYDAEDGFVRHWDEWLEPKMFNRVFVFALEKGKIHGEGIAIDGADAPGALAGHTPTMPFGGKEDVVFDPDGQGVYFVARRAGRDEPTSTDFDIYWSDLSGSAPVLISADNRASDTAPTPSPDGRFLAWLAMERPGYESDRQTIVLRNLETGETRKLAADFDRSFSTLTWSDDSRAIYATALDRLDTPAFRIDVPSGKLERLDLIAGNEAHLSRLHPLASGGLLFARDSIGAPAELYLAENGRRARPITDIATSRMGRFAATRTTRFRFEGADRDPVWGQITRLQDFRGSMPAILYIHGGPQGSFSDSWSWRWNPRVLASQGYAVISVDFHGSAGYGQAFTDSINQDWGGKPLEDLQKGLAAALERDPQIDGANACAMGASYGGYMINWIAGRWNDRFKCLVQHDGLFDLRSFYYSTEELWFPRWDFGASYAEAPENYERWNPVNHVARWKTPMLVVTSEKDFRVPYTQGLQSFTALQERNIPAKLLVFPDENHWVLGAKNSLQWHRTVFAWLDRWLRPQSPSSAEHGPTGEEPRAP